MRSTTSLENPVGFIGNLARALVIGLLASVLTLVPAAQEAKATGAIDYNDNDCQLSDAGYQGTGAEEDPYVISDSESLWEVADCSLSTSGLVYFSISNDINVSEAVSAPTHSPIGLYDTTSDPVGVYSFSGVLRGNGHTIGGISMSSETAFVGLFAQLHNATVENLSIAGTFSTAAETYNTLPIPMEAFGTGALTALSSGHLTLSGVVNSASVIASKMIGVGGLIGASDGFVRVHSSSNLATVSGSDAVGGLIGKSDGAVFISESTNRGGVSGVYAIGGLLGLGESGASDSRINESSNHGPISGTWAGGLVGDFLSRAPNPMVQGALVLTDALLSVDSSHNSGTVSSVAPLNSVLGGLIGNADRANISNSSNAGAISGSRFVGGLFGGFVEFSSTTEIDIVSGEPIEVPAEVNVEASYNSGPVSGTEAVGGLIGASSNSVILSSFNSATVSGDEGIGGLVGHLYGNGLVSSSYNIGSIQGLDYAVGGLLGAIYHADPATVTIHQSSNSGNIHSQFGLAGGLVGYFFTDRYDSLLLILDSFNSGDVSGEGYLGGLGGEVAGLVKIESSGNSGDIFGSGDAVGGLIGYSFVTSIKQSINSGAVHGQSHVGGLQGWGWSHTTVSASINVGTVSGVTDFIGGLIGFTGPVLFLNSLSFLHVVESANTGAVSGRNSVGGLIGRSSASAIVDSYNMGLVSGSDRVGGVIGGAADDTSIATSYNAGSVSGLTLTDGVIGDFSLGFSQVGVFSTEDSSHVSSSSAAALRRADTYDGSGFDFSSANPVWGFGSCSDNGGFPMLRSLGQVLDYSAIQFNAVGCVYVAPASLPPTAQTQTPVGLGAAAYSGPTLDAIQPRGVIGSELVLTGQRLNSVTSIRIGGVLQVISSATERSLRFTVSAETKLGSNDIVLVSSFGTITLQSAIQIESPSTSVASATISALIGKTRLLSKNAAVNQSWFAANLKDSGITRIACTVLVSPNATHHQRVQARKQASRVCAQAAGHLESANVWFQTRETTRSRMPGRALITFRG